MSCHFVAQVNYSGALTHTLTMSPRKLMWECITQKNIAMHIAFRLNKKNPTLKDDEHSRYIWPKKKKNRKRNKKNKKEEIRPNLLYKQIKIKEKLNKFALKAVFKKKINDEQIHSERMPVEQIWAKRDPHHCIQELCKHLDCHWLRSGIESLQSIPLARGAVNTSFIILFLHQ